MGWSGGSRVMDGIIEALNCDNVGLHPLQRSWLYMEIIPILEDEDWDTIDECMGTDAVFDQVVQELHPEWFE